jgi:monoamine oxidase
VDQATLKAASLLHLQQEAASLDLNRRIKALMPNEHAEQPMSLQPAQSNGMSHTQVQKFRFIEATGAHQCYRELLATYLDAAAAAEDDFEKEGLIQSACTAGGNFVGKYYYQYFEPGGTSLVPMTDRKDTRSISLSMSMGFNHFLESTKFPPWSPPVNLEVGQQAMLNMLQLKRDKKGNFVPDPSPISSQAVPPAALLEHTMLPMEPRHCYRVGVVGAGIAGLSACLEIFRQCEREGIDVEIHLVEGRNRLGGRLHTDRTTFKRNDGVTSFPVDLGASWIHGIEMNPLADLAREAGVDFVVTSEEVKMLQGGNIEEVDAAKDKHAGEFFDKLLDAAAEMTWSSNTGRSTDQQRSVRWYASVLDKEHTRKQRPPKTGVPHHRQSSDVSVDHAIGRAVAEKLFDEFQSLSPEERRMLFWNMKNVEYALGANLSDLSQMFWDIDERHAFEGDHVVLRQGYAVVVEHLSNQLRQRGQRFQCHLKCPVGKIEYARSTTSQVYIGKTPKRQTLMDLSDTCCITSEDEDRRILCDFVVCAVPLGVLKHALSGNHDRRLQFDPPLPFPKTDSINNVGFGLLDKIYLQFPTAFWRIDKYGNEETHTLFGNASGVHPHHYMFLDVGRALDTGNNPPAILMSLVSGVEAVDCEWLSTEDVVREVMDTLQTLFSSISVPYPTRVQTTSWGRDRFSRGSYTFLGPGTTDADFHALQSPCNANGDSILLDGFETMRLFFAGEHTTALHPSMAHGAMLSGVRAGREVFDAINLTFELEHIDKLIPMSLYRHMNPKAPIFCWLCRGGEASTEGPLLAFKRGSRCVCVHNNCAEASSEVEIFEGKWENVVKAVNRGLWIECTFCEQAGATIDCQFPECTQSFHYACAAKTGWNFEELGKEFYCGDHRNEVNLQNSENNTLQHHLFTPLQSETMHMDKDEESTEVHDGKVLTEETENIKQSSVRSLRLTRNDETSDRSSTRLVRITRASLKSLWNLELKVDRLADSDKHVLSVARPKSGQPYDDLVEGDVIRMINGLYVGSSELDTMEMVLSTLRQAIDVFMQVESCEPNEGIE